ncbi:PRD domain-containing protein [Metabacillus bambusae]|uniref:PRD domain-containing protein n=1 Tax=Metabacillus bambusae TaxID=2795218 RepID=A0ABS3N5B2_9BACI|nr:PRD domain-containing protein [Metabacillus bambusae]MBO1513482.1 PRD domain-containing protein [Metabacillus bambusae]
MKIKKILNNSAVVVKDRDGEKIVMGEGIGFQKRKNDPVNQAKIDKVFVMKDPSEHQKFEEILQLLPEEHIQVAEEIITYAEKEFGVMINEHIHVAFSDHLSFAIERLTNGISIKNALLDQIKILYVKEFEIGLWAKELIKEKLGVEIPEDEVGNIAMHMHTARMNAGNMQETIDITTTIQEITSIIENSLKINIVEDTMSYERLIIHLRFSVKSLLSNEKNHDYDEKMVNMIKENYKEAFACAQEVGHFFEEKYRIKYPEAELMYISMHIQRFYGRVIMS